VVASQHGSLGLALLEEPGVVIFESFWATHEALWLSEETEAVGVDHHPGAGLDLPGICADSISLTVEQNVLTVRAERAPVKADGAELLIAERPYGTYTRQVFLGETLDADKIAADYAAGVLTLTIPVRESAKPRNIQVTSSDTKQAVTA
jgi:hypothetical protein